MNERYDVGKHPIMFHVISVFDLLSVELISFH